MEVHARDQEIVVTVLSRLPAKCEHLIVIIDDVAEDDKLTLESVETVCSGTNIMWKMKILKSLEKCLTQSFRIIQKSKHAWFALIVKELNI